MRDAQKGYWCVSGAVAIGTGARKLNELCEIIGDYGGVVDRMALQLRSYEDVSYTRTLSQKFTTDCSAQNLDGPFLFDMNAQWPPWSGATR